MFFSFFFVQPAHTEARRWGSKVGPYPLFLCPFYTWQCIHRRSVLYMFLTRIHAVAVPLWRLRNGIKDTSTVLLD